MARADIGQPGNATTTTLAVRIEIIGATTGKRTRVMELGVFNEAATAQVLLLGRALAIGVTPTTPVVALGEDTIDTPFIAASAVAWGTAPTLPTNPLRRISLAAAIGAGVVWSFGPSGLIIPLSGSLIFWNVGTGSAALGFYVVVDE